jgi:A/G-specific adenine glycosylase
VVSSYGGVFPNTFETLLKLPGIGEYTAAAIASFSFKEPVAVVDGNVFRVLSRVFGIEDEINSPEGRKIFITLANSLISKKYPDFHNQAIMEFGALHCVPKNPFCSSCSFLQSCFAAKHNLQSALPRKIKLKSARRRYFYYIVFLKGKSLMMKRRADKDIWEGLYDFQLIEKLRSITPEKILSEFQQTYKKPVEIEEVEISRDYRHVLTHQVINAKFIIIKLRKSPPIKDKNLKFYTFEKIYDLPKPVLITRFLSDYKNFYS